HYLDQHYAHWQSFNFTQAIRYADNDPLEQFLFSSLLLNTSPCWVSTEKKILLDDCQVRVLSSADLIADEALLREVFGLLVLAHYQTRPKDLRHLLDGVGVQVLVVQWQNQVVATALVVREGGFDPILAKEIYYGRRRPQGHLVPQSLAVHAGIAEAPLLTTDRIMRIVVHPELQRQGLGGLLLAAIAKQSQADTLSVSYGVSVGLLQFWQQQGYSVVRIGLTRDASSGRHTAIMLRAISSKGRVLLGVSRQRFKYYLPVLLAEPLRDLEPAIVEKIMPKQWDDTTHSALDNKDKQDLLSYTEGCRQYECCLLAVKKLYFDAEKKGALSQLEKRTRQLLVAKIEQSLDWKFIVQQQGFQGKKQVISRFREGVGLLLAISR
ncbi:MAG TPA: tRNA(Met) cytidine acetyltransferase, partial [Thiotrichaceae bacterium]|nr:tRNA(Met) cytidine acetyltransferase [Thiotrichaceae bacterium]